VWESNLLAADSARLYEERLGRHRKDLASIGTVHAAFSPPRFSSSFPARNNHLDDSTVGFSHRIGHSLRANIHRCASV
jgi:hypothetical protein